MKVTLKRTSIATSTVACVALLSFSWSERRGISLGIESAQARIDRPVTPFSIARVARRRDRRSVHGYGLFGAVAAATTPLWNYDDYYYYCYGDPYVGPGYLLAAITMAATLAATASVAAKSPDSSGRCFRYRGLGW